jgi:hypothetical protein
MDALFDFSIKVSYGHAPGGKVTFVAPHTLPAKEEARECQPNLFNILSKNYIIY